MSTDYLSKAAPTTTELSTTVPNRTDESGLRSLRAIVQSVLEEAESNLARGQILEAIAQAGEVIAMVGGDARLRARAHQIRARAYLQRSLPTARHELELAFGVIAADGSDPSLEIELKSSLMILNDILRLGSGSVPRAPQEDGPRNERSSDVLHVTSDGCWAELPGSVHMDLRRRGSSRRILLALVDAHTQLTGKGLSVEALFEVGWPGQSIRPDAAAERVYASIKALRRMGLQDHLVRHDDGYLLSPSLKVIRR